MSLLSFEESKVTMDIIPYLQDFDGVRILHGEDQAYFEKYLQTISLPIGDDALLQEYFDAWCIKQNFISKVEGYLSSGEAGSVHLKNIMNCEAHRDVLIRETFLRFEGQVDAASDRLSEIVDLQDMKIPLCEL